MKKRWLGTIAALAAAALAVGAMPAFTADTGTITVSVTAEAAPTPATPCIEIADPPGASVNFGTRPFSTPGQLPSTARGDIDPIFRNCPSNTDPEQILINGGDATAPSATWTLVSDDVTCPYGADRYAIIFLVEGAAQGAATTTPTIILTSAVPGEDHTLALSLSMPCDGSSGAGQTFTAPIVLTAVIS